MTNDIAEY